MGSRESYESKAVDGGGKRIKMQMQVCGAFLRFSELYEEKRNPKDETAKTNSPVQQGKLVS